MHTPITSSTTIRSGLGIFALGLISVAVLNACGGGDSVRAPAAAAAGPCDINAPAPTNFLTSASCSTPTAALTAGTVRYLIQGPSTSVVGTTTVFTQETTGAVGALTSIATSSLVPDGGKYAVQAYAGDATFALGRWTRGIATINGGTPITLTGTDSTAVHYLVMQDLTIFNEGNYKCESNLSTSGLTYSGIDDGGTVPANPLLIGAAVPYATISVVSGAATVTLTRLVVAGGGLLEEGYPVTKTLTFASSSAGPQYLDDYQAGYEGVAFLLGRNATPANITLGMAYRRAMSNGARYKGMVSIACSPT